jgi:hypothetical protein
MSKEKFMLHLPEGINLTTLTIPCTLQICPVSSSYIHYAPSLAPTSVLLSIFSILLLTHLYLFTKPRTAISSILISLGLALEVAGHAARIRLHSNPFLRSIYELNLFCLTTAPFFIAAAIYMCFGFAVRVYHANQNEKGSKVRRCVGLLCAWDVVSVGLQVGGSVYASLGPESSKVSLSLWKLHVRVSGSGIGVDVY